jgi:hypothetical protein
MRDEIAASTSTAGRAILARRKRLFISKHLLDVVCLTFARRR